MAYNRFLYNTALYNAGRDEVGAIAKSLIQAHTGPHIQAVVGSVPIAPSQYGLSFISDFVIQEGTLKKPPASFNFPDLTAHIRALFQGVPHDLNAYIKGWYFKDLPAGIYPVTEIPDLPASVFGLLQKDLLAIILGELAEADLGAEVFVPIADLAGAMLGVAAPNLGGRIFGNEPGNLGALIWAPHDLLAIVTAVNKGDLLGTIIGFGFQDLLGLMQGFYSPILSAFLRPTASGEAPLAAYLPVYTPDAGNMEATISGVYGPEDLQAIASGSGGYLNMLSSVRPVVAGTVDVGATVWGDVGEVPNLPAIIDFFGAKNITAYLSTIALGEKDRFFAGYLQAVREADLAGYVGVNRNLANLSAFLQSSTDTADLGAFIRVAETFITAILTVTTMSARDLRATLGSPDCEGGTGHSSLSAYAVVQHALDLGARLDSFVESNLGASVNAETIIHALDVIDIFYSPRRDKKTRVIWATDTLIVTYSPFRGQSLAAVIQAVPRNVDLVASINGTFPLLRVAPHVSRMTAADLRLGQELNIQELRFQLEGTLTSYLYVHGTDDALILDPNEQWQLNVRSFKPIAENLFGDFAASRMCRLGGLTPYATIDEAVRACIASVLGLEGQAELGATVNVRGGWQSLPAALGVSDLFGDLSAVVDRVFPVNLSGTVNVPYDEGAVGGYLSLGASTKGVASTTATLSAFISDDGNDLVATISGSL